MKISIIGFSGFLGSELIKYLKKDKKIKLVKINSRDFSYSKINYFLLKKIFQSEVIINCAASLNPKNKNDIFINKHFPALLCSYNKFFRKRIIHISTVNVLIKDRMDLYSLSKRYGEDKILNNPEIDFIFTTNWFAVSHNLASFHILKARGRGLSLLQNPNC